MQPNATSSMKPSGKPFVENWIQSLTLVSSDLSAQRIKPLMDVVNQLCRSEPGVDLHLSAEKLWSFASSEGLTGLLQFLPTQQAEWLFDVDDQFVFERTDIESMASLEAFKNGVGVGASEFATIARVTSGDWTNLVRNEALRQKRSMSVNVFPDGKNLELACKAHWDGTNWTVRFEQVDWVSVNYEEPFRTKRPTLESMHEAIMWGAANGNDSMIPKQVAKLTQPAIVEGWFDCVPRLKELHQLVLIDESESYAPWFRRAWGVVWPVIYREHNVLRGMIELDRARKELAACITSAPRMTVWMFAYAKLICLAQIGRGLGTLGDFVD